MNQWEFEKYLENILSEQQTSLDFRVNIKL